MDFLSELRKDREIDVIFWRKHPELKKQLVDDAYPDKAHFVYELLQNSEDAGATHAWFELCRDRVVFIHDGSKQFTEKDVEAITDVSKSGKPGDGETIGKFGIGFKSVFAYTETPCIYSGKFSFKITDFVLPVELVPYEELGEKTRFEFPFNNPKKSAETAFSEIKAGLEALSETTLLFVSNLHEIRWRIDDSDSGSVSRTEHPENHIEIRKDSGTGTVSSVHWLRFTAPVDELPKQNVAVAYELGFLHEGATFDPQKRLSEQMKIIPSQGKVSVFFPAEKEASGLRFHLHAPFAPELSRASIKNTDANLLLFRQLANLAAQSLYTIRDLGLLTGEFLAVLPNLRDQLPPRYACIRQIIVEVMRNEPLTPTHNRGHAPARQLVQAKAALKELISEGDLRYLLEGEVEGPKWSINAPQRNSDQDRFLEGLSIKIWDVAQFISFLQVKMPEWKRPEDKVCLNWLSSKNSEWHQRMYSMFYKELSEKEDFSQLKKLKIVRLGDDSYSVGSQCYFPSEAIEHDKLMPRVACAVFSSGASKTQQAEAKKFLEAIGVREIGETEEIERILKERYRPGSNRPNDKIYKADLERFMSWVESNPTNKSLFKSYCIFKTEDEKWALPENTFVDSPYKDTLLSVYYGSVVSPVSNRRYALSLWYKETGFSTERLGAFAEMVGAQVKLSVIQTTCENNPRKDYLYSASGQWKTEYEINQDYYIPELQHLINLRSTKSSQLIWRTMRSDSQGKLKAKYRYNKSHSPFYADSQVVHALRQAEWVPQKDGTFVTPAQASRSQLPEKGFPFEEGDEWLKAVNFGEEEKKQSDEFQQREAKRLELGFESQSDLERALEFVKLPVEEQQRILSEYAQRRNSELPENTPSNPQRRSERVAEQAKDAPERISEERTRSVSVGLEDVKAEANQYLRQQYTNRDDQMICQVCKDELPFKKNDGAYYFECVEFLTDLLGRHYQNYLALCPNHAAMFQHVNGSKELLWEMFKHLEGKEIEVVLAQREMTIYFTETHIADLKAVLSVSSNREDISDITQPYE